jgi:hypothetical protein
MRKKTVDASPVAGLMTVGSPSPTLPKLDPSTNAQAEHELVPVGFDTPPLIAPITQVEI